MDRNKAEEIARRIVSSGAVDTFGCALSASVWEGRNGCRVYVRSNSRSRRELGYVDERGEYVGKSKSAVRKAMGA